MATLHSYVYALALLGSLTTMVNCLAHYENHDSHKKNIALFVLGDSLFDPGNNNYINTTTNFQANFQPYGESFFKYPTGRFSDGRLMPDFIAEFAKLPLIPAYLQTDHHGFMNGINFASAGAGSLVETFSGLVIDLKTQLGYFKKVAKQLKLKLGYKESKTLLSNAVYMFSIGSNDYNVLFRNSTILNSYSQQDYVKMVIGNFTSVIKEIYKEGGRKFVIFSVGPLGCAPGSRALKLQQTNSSGCLTELQDLAKMHNNALPKKLQKLEKTLRGFKYSYFDFFTAAMNVIDNPSRYGFKETETACCGSGPFRGVSSCGGKRGEIKEYEFCKDVGDYLFFDNGHPTEKSNFLSATILWNGGSNLVQPNNVKSLFELV